MKDTHLSTFEEFSKRVIGTPYENLDCWQLVIKFYKEVLGIELPSLYVSRPIGKENVFSYVDMELPRYEQVDRPKFGDIILIELFGYPLHVGIYIDEEKFLHTSRNTDTIIDRLKTWKNRIVGFYRPKI